MQLFFSMAPGESLIKLLAKAEKEKIYRRYATIFQIISISLQLQHHKMKSIPIPDFF